MQQITIVCFCRALAFAGINVFLAKGPGLNSCEHVPRSPKRDYLMKLIDHWESVDGGTVIVHVTFLVLHQ
jgi:hypothetical protein